MPKPTKGARMGGSAAHQKLILANLATALFEHGKITTTEAKARRLRPYAEKLISKACVGDLHNRRQVMTVIRDKSVVHTLFTEIGPRFVTRPGGYTRITKIGPRKGDNAPMAVIALVEALAEATVAEAEGATRRSASDRESAVPVSTVPIAAGTDSAGSVTAGTDAAAPVSIAPEATAPHTAEPETSGLQPSGPVPADDAAQPAGEVEAAVAHPVTEAGSSAAGAVPAAATGSESGTAVEGETPQV